jgi:hypothetical protein
MKKIILALLLLSFLPVTFFSQMPKRRIPIFGTVISKPAAPSKNPPRALETTPKTLGITVEKYVADYLVNTDGTAVETWEMQQRYDLDAVIDRYKKFVRTFNGDLQKGEVLETFILKADGRKVSLPAEAIQIKPTPQAEAAPSFSSLQEIEINFNDLKAGDATYFKIRLTTTKPYFDKQFDFLEVFPFVYQWKSIEINLTAPSSFPLYFQSIDLDGGKTTEENGKTHWQWRKSNLPAFEIEPGMYDFFNNSPRLAVTSFKNFDELGAAYWAETRKKAVVTPEVQTLADEITRDIKDPPQQAYAIYEWVNKNIRYLLVVLDKSGWIPHGSNEILANRYGDCKDYSTILYALLKAKGIESYPVLIRSDFSDWFPEVAVPDYFNHSILYIPSLKLFADATAPNTRLGLITQSIVGKKAILSGEKTGVIETPKDNPEDNRIISDVAIDFTTDGSLKAVSKNTYNGRSEIVFRPLFADSLIQNNSEDFIKMLLGYFGVNGSGTLKKIGNPFKVGEPFTVDLEIEIDNFTTFMPKGVIKLPVGVNLLNTSELEKFVKPEKRQTSLILGATRFQENFQLNFPAGVKIDVLPPAVNFSNSLGSYRIETVFEGTGVKVVRELVINKDIVTAQDYPQIRELINKSVTSNNVEIKYSANPAFSRFKPRTIKKNPLPQSTRGSLAGLAFKDYDEKPLTAAQVVQFETRLKKTPDDIESRKRLLRYFCDTAIKDSPPRRSSRLRHRLWFVQNRPEIDETGLYGSRKPSDSAGETEYQVIRGEWLKQVEANPTNSRIRLNAVEFVRSEEPDQAEKLLFEGRRIDTEDYEFPLILCELLNSKIEKFATTEKAGNSAETLTKAFETGEAALGLLKRERSSERDSKRRKLLQLLAKIAFDLEKFDRARSFATELILDFGQDAKAADYDEATHIGNIILGRIALSEGNTAKAKEFLLIAIRAPLRKEYNYLSKVDTELARELFEKGEKQTVSEYLKLCENLWNFKNYPTLYEEEIKTLKSWQEQINQGKTPSFDFSKP